MASPLKKFIHVNFKINNSNARVRARAKAKVSELRVHLVN